MIQDEAFCLWEEQWGKLYAEDSQSREIISHIMHNYYLVNLVDNDFPKDTCIWDLLDTVLGERNRKEEKLQAMEDVHSQMFCVNRLGN